MSCIKNITSLKNLNLSQNKFTQLSRGAFKNLKSLETLDLSYNQIKKLTPQKLALLVSLMTLKVDQFMSYKNVKTLLLKLKKLSLTTITWNCTQIEAIAVHLNPKIILYFNSQDSDRSTSSCEKKSEQINKLI